MSVKTSSRTIITMSEKDIPHNENDETTNEETASAGGADEAAEATDNDSAEDTASAEEAGTEKLSKPDSGTENESADDAGQAGNTNPDSTANAKAEPDAESKNPEVNSTNESDESSHSPEKPKSADEPSASKAENPEEENVSASGETDSSADSAAEDSAEESEQSKSADANEQASDSFAHITDTAKTYLAKAGHFLGLNKKASAAAAAVALCAVVGIGAAVAGNAAPKQPNGLPLSDTFMQQTANATAASLDEATNKAVADFIACSLTPAALNSIDAYASAPGTFSLVAGQEAHAIPEEEQANLVSAAKDIESGGYTVGFTLINLSTGKGIAYNLDSRVYGASSFKGPYGAYLCQHLGDADTSYPAGADSAGAGISSSIDSLLQPMILNSDNNAFSSLRNAYDSSGFADWLSACGVDSAIMHDTHFPRYSARESALLWLHTYQYLKTETPTAQHLASLYAQTNVSFIRAGVGGVDGVQTVRNKAGWCTSGARFTGLCDAGLIECADGTTYLMSTMTNAPDGSLYTVRLANLANALFACRSALD